MPYLSISPIYILLNILLVIGLAYRITFLRRRFKIGLGDGDKKPLRLAIASHANAIENTPLALLVMILVELNAGIPLVLHISGIVFTAARLWHAWGTSQHAGSSAGRYYGTVLSWIYIIGMSAYGLYLGL